MDQDIDTVEILSFVIGKYYFWQACSGEPGGPLSFPRFIFVCSYLKPRALRNLIQKSTLAAFQCTINSPLYLYICIYFYICDYNTLCYFILHYNLYYAILYPRKLWNNILTPKWIKIISKANLIHQGLNYTQKDYFFKIVWKNQMVSIYRLLSWKKLI